MTLAQLTTVPTASPGPQLQAPFGDRNPGRFRERKQQELPRQARQIPDPLPPKLPANVEKRPESEKRSVPPDQQDLTRSQRQTSSVQEFPRYTGTFISPHFTVGSIRMGRRGFSASIECEGLQALLDYSIRSQIAERLVPSYCRKAANDEAQDFFSESDGQAMPMAMLEAPRSNSSLSMLSRSAETELSQGSPGAVTRPVDSGVSRKSNSEIGEDPNLELVRDTGGGKVRGEDGRYLPKDKPVLSPRSKKNGKKRRERERMAMVKEAEKRKIVSSNLYRMHANTLVGKTATRSTVSEEQDQQQDSEHEPEQEQEQEQEQEPQPESPAPGQDEDVFADVQTPSPSAQNDTIEVHTEPDLPSEGIHGHLSGLSQDTTPEPTLAYLLAAEADAVPSNLDRLPPNSRKVSKRKSKPTSQAEGPLKKRKVGRPRKSEQLGGSVNEQSPQSNMAEAEELPRMTTRRTTRRSAAASVQETPKSAPEVQPEPEKPAVVQAEDDKIVGDTAVEIEANLHTRTSSAHGREDAVMSGVEKDATAGREEQKGQEEVHAPVPTDSASKLGAPSATDSRPSSVTPAATTPRSTKKTAPQISDHDLLNIGLRKTSSPTTQRVAPYVSPYQQVPPQNFTANINRQNAKSNSNMSKVTSKFTSPNLFLGSRGAEKPDTEACLSSQSKISRNLVAMVYITIVSTSSAPRELWFNFLPCS